jgi:hypothetical protein
MAYPKAAPPARVVADPSFAGLLGLLGLDEGRGGFVGAGSSSKKAPGIEDGRKGLEEGVFVLPP